jgi:hypothetical protein
MTGPFILETIAEAVLDRKNGRSLCLVGYAIALPSWCALARCTKTFTTIPKIVANPTLDRRTNMIARLEEQKLLLNDPNYTYELRELG